jgi:hypothetical protein
MRFLLAWLSAATLIAAAPAHAAWNVAKSRHFVIYSNESPKGLHEFAATLERFDQGVRVATNMTDPEVGDGNRLTVFVLPNTADVRALVGDKTGSLAGFYTGRVAGSLAFVGKANAGSEGIDTQTVFFHEYTHHLMMQDLDDVVGRDGERLLDQLEAPIGVELAPCLVPAPCSGGPLDRALSQDAFGGRTGAAAISHGDCPFPFDGRRRGGL